MLPSRHGKAVLSGGDFDCTIAGLARLGDRGRDGGVWDLADGVVEWVSPAQGIELIERFGPDWVRLLWAWLPADSRAATAFYQTCVDVWDGLPALQHHASARTWALSRARHHGERQWRMRARTSTQPLLSSPELAGAVQRVRESTERLPRDPVLEALREPSLDAQDGTLQVAVIARRGLGLDWLEIADVVSPCALDAIGRGRLASELRERVQVVVSRVEGEGK